MGNSFKYFKLLFIVFAIVQSAGIVHAVPVRVDYSTIIAVSTEDFEGFDYTDVGLSEPFNGFTASTTKYPLAMESHSTLCGSNTDTCLFSRTISSAVRSLSDFGKGTQYVGFDLHKVSPTDVFSISVAGGSGNQTFTSSLSGLIAFGDPLGLFRIDVNNLGSSASEGNYSFDDVITGVSVVPLPGAFFLFGVGLVAMGVFRSSIFRRQE